ncbi:dihydroneopterin aldolase [Saccharobesus litoralis]|uniref:7,8-dihydroneopterin aldolase n=1 Tax=Saccharobesus litoralis TaxID=2172099 RepID=A0A2S0VS00_9ALTE|nr:dihydroneopterin aldolase [Saccharobesus litoralis]AWB66880.1 dihydroneopterin aldolase [Saccharobesus litoralis]
MAIVFIENLSVDSCIGVYDWEKRIRQKLIFTIEMAWPNKPAAQTDDINLALDYAKVSQAVCDFASSRQFELIETMAEQVAALIMQQFNVSWLKIKLAKPGAVKQATSVGVIIERGTLTAENGVSN